MTALGRVLVRPVSRNWTLSRAMVSAVNPVRIIPTNPRSEIRSVVSLASVSCGCDREGCHEEVPSMWRQIQPHQHALRRGQFCSKQCLEVYKRDQQRKYHWHLWLYRNTGASQR